MKKNPLTPRFTNAPHFKHFWEQGNGKKLIDWTGAEVSLKHFDAFAPLYYQVDQKGDDVVRDLFLKKPFPEAMELVEGYIKNGVSSKDNVPESVKQLFLESQTVPDWVDHKLLKKGAEVCMKSGVDGLISLRDYSLMGGYDFAYLNKPLIFTSALKKGAIKRLGQTLEFWVKATRYDAMNIHAQGYEMAIKVRLIHSYSRIMIEKKAYNWNEEEWGRPINLWDMTATYCGFSLVFLHGLYLLNQSITREDELGVMHLWKYIGYLLGIPTAYLPNTLKEAVEQFYLWTSIQDSADDDSIHLAIALLEEPVENPILKYRFQRKLLRNAHNGCSALFLDKEVFERLHLHKTKSSFWFPKLVRFMNGIQGFLIRRGIISEKQQILKGSKIQEKVMKDYQRIV